jgi:prevent-host-death family protein
MGFLVLVDGLVYSHYSCFRGNNIMTSVGSFEAKTHLPELLERVSRGEIIQITRRGIPIAQLAPIAAPEKRDPQEAARQIRELRKGIALKGLKLRDLIDEGRA